MCVQHWTYLLGNPFYCKWPRLMSVMYVIYLSPICSTLYNNMVRYLWNRCITCILYFKKVIVLFFTSDCTIHLYIPTLQSTPHHAWWGSLLWPESSSLLPKLGHSCEWTQAAHLFHSNRPTSKWPGVPTLLLIGWSTWGSYTTGNQPTALTWLLGSQNPTQEVRQASLHLLTTGRKPVHQRRSRPSTSVEG